MLTFETLGRYVSLTDVGDRQMICFLIHFPFLYVLVSFHLSTSTTFAGLVCALCLLHILL